MAWSIIGHERAVATLERSLNEETLAHAYLFEGPPQTGRRRLALQLAAAVNCTGAKRPCGECRACRLIGAGTHPDVEVLGIGGLCDEAEHDHTRDGSKEIRICQVRRIERVLALRPFEGQVRVVVVDPAGSLNAYAADAFLKTLEEPPEHVLLILIVDNEEAVSETVRSRCRRLLLTALPAALVEAELIRRGQDGERAQLLAHLSDGRIGWAIEAASDPSLLAERSRRLDRFAALANAGRSERMAFAAELAGRFTRDRQDVYAYLEAWKRWWRDLLLAGEGCNGLVENQDRLPDFQALVVGDVSIGAVRAVRALKECRGQLEANANARLALDVLVLRLPILAAPVL